MTPGRSFSRRRLSQATSVSPRNNGKKISNTETSKVGFANCRNRLKFGMCRWWASKACVAAECDITTPFGVPVDPEVYLQLR